MSVETAIAIAGGYSPRADKRGAMLTRTNGGMPFKSKVPLQAPIRPGDTDQCRRAVVLSVTALAQPLKILHVFRAPVGGPFPARDRPRARAIRARAPGRPRCGFKHRRRACRSRLCGTGAASSAWRKPHSDGPAAGHWRYHGDPGGSGRDCARAPDVVHGHGAKGAAYARLAGVPRPRDPGLHAAWRQPALRARRPAGMVYITLEKILKSPHRSLSVRKRISSATLFDRRIGAPRAMVQGRPQRRRRGRVRRKCRRRRPRPISSTSANSAPSKAWTF